LALADQPATRWSIDGEARIGRAPGNDVILPEDLQVSKEHALLFHGDGRWWIHDLKSVNGTFVNGRRVAQAALRDGDELALGRTHLVFRLPAGLLADTSRSETPLATPASPLDHTVAIAAPVDDKASFQPAEAIDDPRQLERDYEKLRIAHAFNRAMRNIRGARDVSKKVLEVAFEILPADSGAVLLRDRKTGKLRMAAVKRRQGGGEVVVSETLVDRAVRSREGVLTADALDDSRFNTSESVVSQGLRSAMAVPLVGSTAPGEVRGVLFLETHQQVGAFEEKDLILFAVIGAQASYVLENAELADAREHLARYLPPPLVEQAARGDLDIDQAGTAGQGTILFADLRGFTALASRLSPAATVEILNQLFEGMVAEVFAESGVLDKFLGDGLMALFGLPVQQEDAGAGAALRCALRMQERMVKLNERRSAAGEVPLALGIGVDTGTVVVGSMGCALRMEYTAIGDAVNVASRMCGVALGGQVLCGAATAERARSAFSLEPLPPQRFKGKDRPVPIYRVGMRRSR
jgi:adenylate cyclase